QMPRNGEFGQVTNAFERLAVTVTERTASLRAENMARAKVEDELRDQMDRVREAEERFRLLVEVCPSGVCVVDESGTIILVNRTVDDLFGYERDELLGHPVETLMAERLREGHESLRLAFMQDRSRRLMGAGRDLVGRRKDGTEVAVEVGLCPLTLDGTPVVMASIVDVTERRRERAKLAQYASRLEDTNAELARTNAELEKFAYVVSHDIKAPLRGISSVATWIAEDFGTVVDDEARENLDLMLERTSRLGRLIDGILAYSRAGRAEHASERVTTGSLISDVISSVAPPEEMSVRLFGDFPTVSYNETQLRQIFQNLIDNAIKHLGRPDGEIVITCEEGDDEWCFFIRDNGVGIPERHFERIFELFQTLRPKDKSGTTGAGLAITRRIVEANGGTIRVSSTEGKGTVFSFTIPKVRPPVPAGAAEDDG
ncbi:MAG: PAS domain S-box protein, partial [Phycisphaerales bacterium]|nr:PAS domain S-box protein [Phycisphaerales bacterium]